MRVLVTAYACEPGRGSEHGAGWNIVTRLANYHDVWVVTRAKHKTRIEAELGQWRLPNLHFLYHDVPRLLPIKRFSGGLYLYHYVWHLSLRSLAAALHRQIGFDVAHHLTLGSFRYPSGLTHLGIPLVIGPVGGAEETPLGLWRSFGWRGAVIETLRWASNRVALLDPFVRLSYRKAAFTFAVTRHTREHLSGLVAPEKIQILPLSGVDPSRQRPLDALDPGSDTLNVLYVARLIHWKGWDLAVRAIAAAGRVVSIRLTILGTGPDVGRLKALIARLGIMGSITLIPRLETNEDVYRLYREHDVFLFPSLHESGGMAVLEAMAAGLPVVCLDLGGPGVSVTEECGIVVQPTTRPRVVAEMASALLRLARDRGLRQKMGNAGRRRAVEAYAWEVKARTIESLYRRLLS
jgi:glycosyltransferase involved in cell wall biosynthesis